MWLVDVHRVFARQDVKRRELEVRQAFDRPAIAPVGLGVGDQILKPLGKGCRQARFAHALVDRSERSHRVGQSDAACSADSGVLLTQQLLSLGRPRQQLGVEDEPVRGQLGEEPCCVGRAPDTLEEAGFAFSVVEEAASGPRVADAEALVDDAEAPARNLLVLAHDDDCA